ncbi:hypothetical protein IU486_30400 [Streptomyces gardneri]|uniref:hypothetical protein n=1 Tax=Nocardia TaxID=1817 RepID=UPI00135C6420|nr:MULTISPECIES: hypothetical protein [Nocardia]MBF6169020.1 hypothetical protein [Streptomyces gardneri]MBF6208538.1 hypothetical protein [Streptomyces gardneri]
MGFRMMATALLAGAFLALSAPVACAENGESEVAAVPPRTAISIRTVLGPGWGTANEHESRSSLSLAKLFMADYALRHGDGSPEDRVLAEQMIRYSDDGAATTMEAKYPQAVAAIAAEYGLTATVPGPNWGAGATSVADVSDFLAAKLRTDPGSPIFEWMAAAGSTALDGTEQDWGTARLPFVLGTKWGWSDFGEPEVASASYGPGFAVTAHTRGTAAEQTADVMAALTAMITGSPRQR